MLKLALARVYNHFFSVLCPGCKIKKINSNSIFCQNCYNKLKFTHQPYCPVCGGTLDGILEICSKCLIEEYETPWIHSIAVLQFNGYGQKLIQRFKYNNDIALARPLAVLAVKEILNSKFSIDVITSIPLHWRKKLFRGYNQSELIAKFICKHTDTAYSRVLIRNHYTPSQTRLSGKERRRNLKNAFSVVNNKAILNKNILLIDDVFTTGSTLRSAANKLLESGAASISVLALARR